MRIFFAGQGRTRVCGEAYFMYAAAVNPRRTQSNGKKAIYGWTLFRWQLNRILQPRTLNLEPLRLGQYNFLKSSLAFRRVDIDVGIH